MSTHVLPAQPSFPSQTSEIAHLQRKISFEVIALGFIILLCALLRFYHLGAASLWGDEIFSRYYVDLFGLHYVLTEGLSRETNPPTYYLLLRGWMSLFGDSETALRSLSAAISIVCVPVTYLLGRELGGKSRGLAGALLVALCPASVYFAQETRVYALFMLASAMLLWAAAVYQRNSRSLKARAFYLLSATFCLYLHATGLLLVVACWGAVWLYLLGRGTSTRQVRFQWMLLNGFVLLLGLPYFLHVFTASHTGNIDYMPPAGIHQLVYCVSLVVSGMVTPYPWPAFLLATAVFLTLAVSLWLKPLSRRASFILIGVPCLFITLVLLVSFRRPILLPRILVWTVVPLCLIAGDRLLNAGRARYVVLLGLLAAFGTGLFFQMTAPNSDKEPWRDISREVGPDLERADLVVLSPVSNPMVLSYYAPRVKNVRLWDASLSTTVMSAAADRLHIPSISEAEILQAIKTKHSVWVLSHSFDLDRVNDLRSQVPATVFREWFCGKVPCAAVVAWQQPHP
jgi:mannosyltransferase